MGKNTKATNKDSQRPQTPTVQCQVYDTVPGLPSNGIGDVRHPICPFLGSVRRRRKKTIAVYKVGLVLSRNRTRGLCLQPVAFPEPFEHRVRTAFFCQHRFPATGPTRRVCVPFKYNTRWRLVVYECSVVLSASATLKLCAPTQKCQKGQYESY